jgi:hypothetical protein
MTGLSGFDSPRTTDRHGAGPSFNGGLMDLGVRLRSASALVIIVLALAASVMMPDRACAVRADPLERRSTSFLHEAPNTSKAVATSNTVVLADPDDAYYALAGEITQRDGARLVGSLEEAFALDPEFLLWVVSPSQMSDAVLVDFGRAMETRESAIAVGVISGTTMEKARELWLRRSEVQARLVVAANAANPSGNIASGITAFGAGGTAYHPLTLDTLTRYLQRADYLTYTGHGGRSHLELYPDVWLTPDKVPELSSIVVATGSCNTFRIWDEDSIALAFVDRGAAAYAGFAYSPNEGYLIGEFSGVPLRYTWPGFPIGHVIQVQNRGALQGFASFPYYYLLGDPRLALQSDAPYRLVADDEVGDVRTLTYADAPAGFIPVHIPGGARYAFVEVPGVTSAWKSDPFYNARLQMINIGEDKYVLFKHAGGDFTLILHQAPAWYWLVTDYFSDSLDHVLLYLGQTGGDLIGLFLGGLAWLTILSLLRWVERGRLKLMASALSGAVFAALHASYAYTRLGDVTITSKTVQFGPLSLVGTFLITGAGAFLFLSGRSWRPKALAVILGTMPVWAAICFSFAVISAVNIVVFRPELGTGAYNYALALVPIGALVVESLLLLGWYSLLGRLVARSDRMQG